MSPQTHYRMHPLIAAAAASVIVVSVMGMAKLAGVFPGAQPLATGAIVAPAVAATVRAVTVSDAVNNLPASSVPAATSLDAGEAIVPVHAGAAAEIASANPADRLLTERAVHGSGPSADVAAKTKLDAVPAQRVPEHRRHAQLARPRQFVARHANGGILYGASASAGETSAGIAPVAGDQAPRIVPVYRPTYRAEEQPGSADSTPASPTPTGRNETGEGTALGRSISFGIDHTVSAIADLLSGGNPSQAPLSERRSPTDLPAR